MIMKGCVHWNTVTIEKVSALGELESRTARSVGQHITTELP